MGVFETSRWFHDHTIQGVPLYWSPSEFGCCCFLQKLRCGYQTKELKGPPHCLSQMDFSRLEIIFVTLVLFLLGMEFRAALFSMHRKLKEGGTQAEDASGRPPVRIIWGETKDWWTVPSIHLQILDAWKVRVNEASSPCIAVSWQHVRVLVCVL